MIIRYASFRSVAAVALVSIVLACAPTTNEAGKVKKADVGTVGGALIGGLLGSQVGKGSGNAAAVAVGALAGGFIGHSVGKEMDAEDLRAMRGSQQNALEYAKTNQKVVWKNPDTGNSGDFTPKRTYVEQGRNCREYTQTIMIGGKVQSGFGKACRRDDGSWEIVQ